MTQRIYLEDQDTVVDFPDSALPHQMMLDVQKHFYPEKFQGNSFAEIGKAGVRGGLGTAGSIGALVKWYGDTIQSKPLVATGGAIGKGVSIQEEYLNPFKFAPGGFTTIGGSFLQKKKDKEGNDIQPDSISKAIGSSISNFGDSWHDYFQERIQSTKIGGVEIAAADPALFRGDFMENPSWTRAVAAVSSAIPSLATSAAVTLSTGNLMAGAVLLGTLEGSEQYKEAKDAGTDQTKADIIGLTSVIGTTVLEKLALDEIFTGALGKVLARKAPEQARRIIRNLGLNESKVVTAIGRASGSAIAEGGQESAQTLLQNAIAKFGYDPTRKFADGLVESFIGGAGSGALVGSFVPDQAKELDKLEKTLRDAGATDKEIEDIINVVSDQMIKKSDDIDKIIKDKIKNARSTSQKKKDVPQYVTDKGKTYEDIEESWHQLRDSSIFAVNVNVSNMQKKLTVAMGKEKVDAEVKEMDKVISRFIDLKTDPEILNRKVEDILGDNTPADLKGKSVYEALPQSEQVLYDRAKNLSPAVKQIANEIEGQYKRIGKWLVDHGIIKGLRDHYIRRDYVPRDESTFRHQKNTGFTGSAQERQFKSYAEAQIHGFELKRDGATTGYQAYAVEMANLIADRKFIEELSQLKTAFGDEFLSVKHQKGYMRLDAPIFEGRFAPVEIAKIINNMFSENKLRDIKFIEEIQKNNDLLKQLALTFDFFHHIALGNSYMLGIPGKKGWSEWNPFTAYKDGLEAIYGGNEIVQRLVRNGMTLGLMQDWDQQLNSEENLLTALLDKIDASETAKNQFNTFKDWWLSLLFERWGAGLKAKAGIILYNKKLEENPGMSPNEIAKAVGEVLNADFGGLHHKRMHRNASIQAVLRLLLKGPDWTESNVHTILGAFGKPSLQRELYRDMWASVFTKGLMMMVLGTLAVSTLQMDDEDEDKKLIDTFIQNYTKAWENGKLTMLGVHLEPLLKKFGVETKNDHYWFPMGHFLDPLKWISRDVKRNQSLVDATKDFLDPARWASSLTKTAYYKAADVPQIMADFVKGSDYTFWRKWTSISEMLGIDPKDKGENKGKLVRWKRWNEKDSGRAIKTELGQIPAFVAYQSRRAIPVPVVSLIDWALGENDLIDIYFSVLGLPHRKIYTKTTKSRKDKQTEKDNDNLKSKPKK